jgi:protein phosphatase
MGTTLTVASIQAGRSVTIFQAGDSRAYHFHGGRLCQITKDHSFVAEEILAGRLKPEEVSTHPKRHVITRAFGNRPFLDVDVYRLELEMNDDLLLCSDGLYGGVPDESIGAVLGANPPVDRAVTQLMGLALDAGGHDNLAIVLVRVRERLSLLGRIRAALFGRR